MIRRIITIDEEKCSGCGLCASACHEGAIGMVNGKAKLLHEHYCDGLGDCLPACPENAISFEEREAPAYDEAAVLAAKAAKKEPLPCGCPGTVCQTIEHDEPVSEVSMPGQLSNFPVQIKLVAPEMRLTLTEPTFSSPRTVRPTPTEASTKILSGEK